MTNLTDHQYAGDARNAFGFGGSGAGRMHITSDWGTDNLATDDEGVVYKAAKACFVSNFALAVDIMDTHATPLLTFDVGTAGDDNAFISAASGSSGVSTVTNAVDESTVAGTKLAAGDTIIISVLAGAATAAAGQTTLSFDVANIE